MYVGHPTNTKIQCESKKLLTVFSVSSTIYTLSTFSLSPILNGFEEDTTRRVRTDFWTQKVKTFSKTIIYFPNSRLSNVTSHTKRSLRTNARHANLRQANGWEMDSQAIRNGTAEWMNGWRKCLNGWGRADKRMTKIFEWMQSNGWTAEEKFWATGCDVLSISRFDELEQIHGVRYVFNAFLRSRKAFAWSRKNYNTVVNPKFPHLPPNGLWRIFSWFSC